jgi:hypothetical protein
MLRSCALCACEQQQNGAVLLLLCGQIYTMRIVAWTHGSASSAAAARVLVHGSCYDTSSGDLTAACRFCGALMAKLAS